MREAGTFAQGTLCDIHQLNLARRLARRAVAARIREHDLLTEYVHRFRGCPSLDDCLLGGLLPLYYRRTE